MLALHLVVMADWPRNPDLDGDAHLPRDGVADLPGDLVGVLDGPLLALPLRAGLALGSAGLTVFGLCLPLAVAGVATMASISSMMDLRVAADNSSRVLDMLGNMVALLRHDILAILHIGGVHHGVILGVALLVVLRMTRRVCGRVIHGCADLLAVAVMPMAAAIAGCGAGQAGDCEGEDEDLHHCQNIFPPEGAWLKAIRERDDLPLEELKQSAGSCSCSVFIVPL